MRGSVLRWVTFTVAALGLVLAVATPAGSVSAAPPISDQQQVNALASVEGVFSLEVLSPGKLGDVTVCIAFDETGEEGCADASGLFSIDTRQLASASLAPIEIQLIGWVCEGGKGGSCDAVPTRVVTVSADWTGVGTRQHVNERQEMHQAACLQITAIKGSVRDASAAITVDGETYDAAGNLQSLRATTRCH